MSIKVIRAEATYTKEYNYYYADLVFDNGQVAYYCYNVWPDPDGAVKFAEKYLGKTVNEISHVSWCLLPNKQF